MSLNKFRGEVMIELDRPRKLRITVNDLITVQEMIGKEIDLPQIIDMGARGIRALLFVCFRKDDPEITLERVGELIGYCDLVDVHKAIAASAFGGKVPDEVADQARQLVNGEVKNAQSGSAGQSPSASAGPSASA